MMTRESKLAYKRQWYQDNKEEAKARVRQWRKGHPDTVKGITRKQRLRRLGMTPADYDALWKKQGGCCAICERAEWECKGRRLDVDHDHTTGKVRGLLCRECNMTLGMVGDDAHRLMRAVKYLDFVF